MSVGGVGTVVGNGTAVGGTAPGGPLLGDRQRGDGGRSTSENNVVDSVEQYRF